MEWEVQKFDIQFRSATFPFGKSNHLWVGFECIDLAHSRGIVVNEIYAGTHADLQNFPLSQGDDRPANFLHRLWVAQRQGRLARTHHTLGKVTVVDRNGRLMSKEDPDVCEALRSLLADEGIDILLNARIKQVSGKCGDSVSVVVEQNGIEKVLKG
jgi:pyridine nucleotide-disulfide oxidoreductase